MSKIIYRHKCKECNTNFYAEDNKLLSIASCPKCNGSSVYAEENKIVDDGRVLLSQDELDSLMYSAAQSVANKLKLRPDDCLLVIELQDETSVPRVFYKGNEIKWKTTVEFDWETDTSIPGGLTYAIEYHERNKRQPTINRIERRVKGHAVD